MWKFISFRFIFFTTLLVWPRFPFELTPSCLHTPKRTVKETNQRISNSTRNFFALQQLILPDRWIVWEFITWQSVGIIRLDYTIPVTNQLAVCMVWIVAVPSWRKFYDFYSQPRNGYHILFIWFRFYASYTIILGN